MCEKLIKKTGGFCKRLFSNCVDHKNLKKFSSTVICGFFFENDSNSDDVISLNSRKFCAHPREKCILHFGWERNRLASIEQNLFDLVFTLFLFLLF